MRYLLELSYNGAPFHGWQRQPNAISVQQVVEESLSTIMKEKITVVGAGRTDSGVHAKYFCAHFDYSKKIIWRYYRERGAHSGVQHRDI